MFYSSAWSQGHASISTELHGCKLALGHLSSSHLSFLGLFYATPSQSPSGTSLALKAPSLNRIHLGMGQASEFGIQVEIPREVSCLLGSRSVWEN